MRARNAWSDIVSSSGGQVILVGRTAGYKASWGRQSKRPLLILPFVSTMARLAEPRYLAYQKSRVLALAIVSRMTFPEEEC